MPSKRTDWYGRPAVVRGRGGRPLLLLLLLLLLFLCLTRPCPLHITPLHTSTHLHPQGIPKRWGR
jgi:hypothetical protein